MEIWKKIPGHDPYSVSDHGRVQNLKTGKFLKGSIRPDGYTQMNLGRGKQALLHRLVLLTFRGPCPAGLMGCHEDDVPANNALSNLRWGTSASNGADRVRNRRARGVDAAAAKFTREQIMTICAALDAGEKLDAIAKRYGTTRSAITHINTGVVWAWLTGRSSENSRCPTHKNHARKLSAEKVATIRERVASGQKQNAVALEFGVAPQTIAQVISGRIWAHTEGRE